MRLLRRKCPPSQLQPDLRFIRTLQSPFHVVPDQQTGRYRISSKAFSASKLDGGLSGDLEQILQADGLQPTALYPAVRNAVGAAAIPIGKIQEAGGNVCHDPVWRNWYHGSVFNITDAVKRKIFKSASEMIEIDQAEAAKFWEVARR